MIQPKKQSKNRNKHHIYGEFPTPFIAQRRDPLHCSGRVEALFRTQDNENFDSQRRVPGRLKAHQKTAVFFASDLDIKTLPNILVA